MIEEGLVLHLSQDAGVSAIVVEGSHKRIYPIVIPQKTAGRSQLPCIVYSVTGENRTKTYCGTVKVIESIIAIDCYAKSLVEARRLSIAVRRAILDFRGVMGNVRVRDVTLTNSMTLNDMEPGLMRVADSYSIWHEQE